MERKIMISPSIMCCRFWELEGFIRSFEQCGVDTIHFDVMDGHYVSNVMLGTAFYKQLKEFTSIPVDLHFMCENPETFIDYFMPEPGDWVSFHPETCRQPYRLLQDLRKRGLRPGLVLNPGTPLSYLEENKSLIDFAMLMTVNPGFAGQTTVPDALSKMSRIKKLLEDYRLDADLVVDGNTTFENAKKMKETGANVFVVGTSSILKDIDAFPDQFAAYTAHLAE
ncbi:ribulose-phosphate 3-epimerase [Oscillospiraceae bacterium MB08-C2-2]|nr:ribulose-phosphate 3-epimerase [Oscillospiraceae bacterium MB08-C2-2]